MKHGSLFSGIGGFDLAAQWMGWDNVFHCEWNEFAARHLKYYWPNAIHYNDITQTDFTFHRGGIDILTGGFPCQPYSTAGKRLGKDDERHLWPHMLRAIREISPRWVVGENVRGLVNWNGGLVFEEVQADLEAAGYEVIPFLVPAAGVGAPHRRDRIWFIAYAEGQQDIRRGQGRLYTEFTRIDTEGIVADAAGDGHEHRGLDQNRSASGEGEGEGDQRQWLWNDPCGTITERITSDADNINGRIGTGGQDRQKVGDYSEHDAAYANGADLQGCKFQGSIGEARSIEGQSRRFSEPVCRQWEVFPTQSPICGGNDGLPTQLDGITFSKWRNESLKGYGNAVVPQVVLQIFKAIQQYEQI